MVSRLMRSEQIRTRGVLLRAIWNLIRWQSTMPGAKQSLDLLIPLLWDALEHDEEVLSVAPSGLVIDPLAAFQQLRRATLGNNMSRLTTISQQWSIADLATVARAALEFYGFPKSSAAPEGFNWAKVDQSTLTKRRISVGEFEEQRKKPSLTLHLGLIQGLIGAIMETRTPDWNNELEVIRREIGNYYASLV